MSEQEQQLTGWYALYIEGLKRIAKRQRDEIVAAINLHKNKS